MPDRLDTLIARLDPQEALEPGYRPPVEQWNPPLSGEIDICIDNDGVWYHEGVAFQRHDLMKLFSSLLTCEQGQYFLVSPVEKWRIQVEDVPFVLVFMEVDAAGQADQLLHFRTQVGDRITIDETHPLTLLPFGPERQLLPYVSFHRDLKGRVSRNVYYQLIELAEEGLRPDGTFALGVRSGGCFFPLE